MEIVFPKFQVPVLQNRVFETHDLAVNSDRGYIEVRQNNESGLYENVLFDSSKLNYDANYDNEQANSEVFQNHLNDVVNILSPVLIDKKVIEVGCGKGHFLELLLSKGVNAYGCDPTYTGSNDRVIKNFFSESLNLSGDVIILRHVLEHIQHPIDFLKTIADVNGNKGLIYIEVPDFNWIVNNQTYFDIFYEHVNYFRPDDFLKIFGNIVSRGTLFQGQYQYVLADLGSIQMPPYAMEDSDNVAAVNFTELDRLVKELSVIKKPLFIWGAASKGVILALHLHNAGIEVDNLIDINPNKQGKFTALTGIQIISPEEFNEKGSGSTLIIVNPNYEQEIRKLTSTINQVTFIIL